MEEIRVTLELGKAPEEYAFTIDRRPDFHVLHIPGDHRGPDLCFPERPEQEEWLNSLVELMTPFWHCQWKFRSCQACDDFIEYLKELEGARQKQL